MSQNDAAPRFYLQVELQGMNMAEVSIEADRLENGKVSDLKNFDDDGRIKRKESGGSMTGISMEADSVENGTGSDTRPDDPGHINRQGTFWTASASVITFYEVVSLAWATAQLGWITGPIAILAFSFVTYYTSVLLIDFYRTSLEYPITRRRNYINLDGFQIMWIGGFLHYATLFATVIGYTIVASMSMAAIERSNCFNNYGHGNPCHASNNRYMIVFGAIQILLSQASDLEQIWWLFIVSAVMPLTYSTIGIGLSIAKIAEARHFRGSFAGATVGTVTANSGKIWNTFQALGNIAFAHSSSLILIEIQDTTKSPPAGKKTMKKTMLLGVGITTVFYMLCGCIGYAAFGDNAPENLFSGFGFYDPLWLIDIANAAIVIHLVGAYQVYSQLFFAFIEGWSRRKWPEESQFINKKYVLPMPFYGSFDLNIFKLVWRTCFVVIITFISMLFPFFNNVVGLVDAVAFWPLTIYFPVAMHIEQNRIRRWSSRWIALQILSIVCLVVSIIAAIGSTVRLVEALKSYKPFKATY